MHYLNVWDRRSEDDVLDCLEKAYNTAGYNSVINFHKYDRPHEKGVDLECKRLGETIHLQVKIKPRSKDRSQLQKLWKK